MMLHRDSSEQLKFLKEYFKGEDRKYFQTYVKFNRDVVIVEDCSAGSNATTLLCLKEGQMFYRKYIYGSAPDLEKLKQQYEWIATYSDCLSLPKVLDTHVDDILCYYDMAYENQYISGFSYIHSVPPEIGWETVKHALDDIDRHLYQQSKPAEGWLIEEYIDSKVTQNLEMIKNSTIIKSVYKYDILTINGKSYKNLKQLSHLFEKDVLLEIFKNDVITPIHGDLTIENIICSKTTQGDYYIIDPNVENIHNTPYLDYAKLLQSLHGSYEFMMKLDSYERYEDQITYLADHSMAYEYLYQQYHAYLSDKFEPSQVKSIYFHELIHWLRLMPYKIKKDGDNALIFYCQMVKVANDIEKQFFEGE